MENSKITDKATSFFSRIKSVQTKFILWIIPSLTILMFILFGILYLQEKANRLELIENYSLELTKASSNEITATLESITLELKQIAKRNIVQTMDWDVCGNDLIKIANKRKDIYGFICLINPDGSYYTTLNGLETKKLDDKAYFKEVFNEGKESAISDPYNSVTTGQPIFLINIAIKRDDGTLVGSLAGVVYLTTLSKISGEIKLGDLGYGFMMDNSGSVFAHPKDDLRMKLNVLTSSKDGFINLETVGRQMINSESGYGIVTRPDGIEEYLFYNRVPGSPNWTLGIALPTSEIFSQINALLIKLLAFLLIMLIGIYVLIWILSKNVISKPLKTLITYTTAISEGHLYNTIDSHSEDEVGQMAGSLQSMSSQLKTIVENIRDSANMISGSSRQLNGAAEQIAQGANEQASSSEEISSSMEEMVSTIDQNADNAQMTERIAVNIAQNMDKVAKASQKSLESVRSIVEKIGIIGEIAEKTDLLAINAAVEAARAGEYGKGFAVVATEVRKLAEYSQKAANEIVNLSTESLSTTEEAGKLMQSIVPDIGKNADLVREISAASVEQNSGANQVNQAIQQFSEITQQNAAAAEELATSSEEMSTQAINLNQMVSFFKIDESEATSVNQIFDMIEKHNLEIAKLKNKLVDFGNNEMKMVSKPMIEKGKQEKQPKNEGIKIDLKDENDGEYEKY